MILSVIAVIFTFGLVIFLHELGHFIACRLAGMRVVEFAMGFGPEIIGWGPKPPEEKKDDKNSRNHRPPHQKRQKKTNSKAPDIQYAGFLSAVLYSQPVRLLMKQKANRTNITQSHGIPVSA